MFFIKKRSAAKTPSFRADSIEGETQCLIRRFLLLNILTDNRQYEVTSTDVKIVDLPYNLNSYFLKAGITAYIGRSLYGKNNIYRHGCT